VQDTVGIFAEYWKAFLLVSEQISATDALITRIDTAKNTRWKTSTQVQETLNAINTVASRGQDTSADMTGHVKGEMDGFTSIARAIQQDIIGMGEARHVRLLKMRSQIPPARSDPLGGVSSSTV
jgi:hypothetical protein